MARRSISFLDKAIEVARLQERERIVNIIEELLEGENTEATKEYVIGLIRAESK